jgi:hypothetical protein
MMYGKSPNYIDGPAGIWTDKSKEEMAIWKRMHSPIAQAKAAEWVSGIYDPWITGLGQRQPDVRCSFPTWTFQVYKTLELRTVQTGTAVNDLNVGNAIVSVYPLLEEGIHYADDNNGTWSTTVADTVDATVHADPDEWTAYKGIYKMYRIVNLGIRVTDLGNEDDSGGKITICIHSPYKDGDTTLPHMERELFWRTYRFNRDNDYFVCSIPWGINHKMFTYMDWTYSNDIVWDGGSGGDLYAAYMFGGWCVPQIWVKSHQENRLIRVDIVANLEGFPADTDDGRLETFSRGDSNPAPMDTTSAATMMCESLAPNLGTMEAPNPDAHRQLVMSNISSMLGSYGAGLRAPKKRGRPRR